MITFDDIKNILLDLSEVSNIYPCREGKIDDLHNYEIIINCDIFVDGKPTPIYVAIPEHWTVKLIDIYIKEYNKFPFIPHVENNGRVCLFDLEGAFIDPDLGGVIKQCISSTIKLIEKELKNDNSIEFIKEFSSYWINIPGCIIVPFALPQDHATKAIKSIFIEKASKKNKKKKHNTQEYELYADCSDALLAKKFPSHTINNALFCHIEPKESILPPDNRHPLNLKYVNSILRLVSCQDVVLIYKKIMNSYLIIFEIIEPNGDSVCIGIFYRNGEIKINDLHEICIVENEGFSLTPVFVERTDKEFLLKRTATETPLDLRILLIGCGSIGSYLCNELVRAGWSKITIVDKDILHPENIYRHLLGLEYVGQNKAQAMCQYFDNNLPELSIRPLSDDATELIGESIELNEYDIIISAVGDHKFNRWLNQIILSNEIDAPVLYTWNEPLDIGSHAMVIQRKYAGDYNSIFTRDEDGTLYDATAYTKRNQIITKNLSGCGGSFIPYGSIASLNATALCMRLIDRYLRGECVENIIASIKGDGFYFRKSGLKTSQVYEKQQDMVEMTEIIKFSKRAF